MSTSPQDCRLRFSIVIPCFNAARHIAATLNSIERQNYPEVEVLVIDGQSNDGTLDVVASHKDLQIRVISEPDRGQLDAVQKGLRVATGDVCYWLNADDILMPGTLQYVNSIFVARPDIDLVFSDDFAFDEENRVLAVGATIRGFSYLEHILFYRQMYSECIFWRSCRTRYLPDSFFDLRLCTDYAFFSNLRRGLKERWVSKRLGAFRQLPGQISDRYRGRLEVERRRIREYLYHIHGWTRWDVFLRRVAIAPRFFVLQLLYPRINAGVRKIWRILTRDVKRRRMTTEFFDTWLINSIGTKTVNASLLRR
jgi:glycosyltransferase involved in cell wall biosynthesis